MPLNRGRPRTRPPVRRIAVEIDQELLAAVELAAGASPYRVIVEEALRLWLESKQSGSPMPDLRRMEEQHRQR
jgi:Arc/MetJ family transcription regulator